jgi:hypothetical protein
MPAYALSRPDPSEYATYYESYIRPVAGEDIPELLKSQPAVLEPLRSIGDSDAKKRYAPDKWSVKEVIGHVNDAERIFAYRMLRIARGDQTALSGFEQQPYVDVARFDRLPIAQLVDAFGTARASTISLMGEIDADGWRRMGTASGFPVSARAIAYIIAGHAAHHLGVLLDRYGVRL